MTIKPTRKWLGVMGVKVSDVQFRQKSIPIQFRFRTKPFDSIPIPIPPLNI